MVQAGPGHRIGFPACRGRDIVSAAPTPARNPPMHRPLLVALLLVLGLPGCAAPDVVLDKLDLQDLPAPAMFRQTSMTLKRPYVLELPPRSIDGRFDLKMENVSLSDAFDAMVKLDPQFQHGRRGEALSFFPSSKADLEASPFSKRLDYRQEAGLGEVVRGALTEAGLIDSTNIVIQTAGSRRPVKLDVSGVTLREAFLEMAAQAHVAFVIEPGSVSVVAVPQ